MEAAAKRKRAEQGEGEGRRKKVSEVVGAAKEAEVKAKAKAKAEPAVPTEEEVEEFFAILRRMNVVVRYFEKGKDEEGHKLTRNWRTALETEAMEGVHGVKRGERVEECMVLDLNAAPDQTELNTV